MYLLDTCTFMWLVADQKRLSKKAIQLIMKHPQSLFISSITAFEITIKHNKKRIVLPEKPERWISEALEFHNIKEIPLDTKIATVSASLPFIHNDPCDRSIIATAKLNDMTIITCDSVFSKYHGVNVIW